MAKDYNDLNIWKLGIKITKEIYTITEKLPGFENYSLSSQMRRASISIPSNIAEGFARQYNKEYKQFLYIALGSIAELETQFVLTEELGYLKEKDETELKEELRYLSRMIMSLIKKLN